MHGSSLKNKFVIYSPQITTNLNVTSLINSLRENSDIEIEHHDILMSAETAENILAYRKADLVITTTPVHNRSIVCTHFKTIDCVLVCSGNHPRINETSTLEQIQQEQFTYFSSEDQGIKDYRSRASESMAFHKVGFSSDSLLSIANVIASTDIIGVIPRQIYEIYQPALKFKEIKTDFELPKVKLFIMYNRASLNNKAFAEYISKLSLDS